MVWKDLLFAHWTVDPTLLRPHLPEGVRLHMREGAAWVGAAPFAMDIRPRLVPPLGPLTSFLELNLRTYVTVGGEPGVWFFSLDAERRLAVWAGRRCFHLPYFRASMSRRRTRAGAIRYESERTHAGASPAAFRATYRPAGPLPEEEEPLARWLTERYRLYASDGSRIHRVEVRHRPWTVRRAEVDLEVNSLGEDLGIPLEGGPRHALFSRRLEVLAWRPEPARSSRRGSSRSVDPDAPE